MGRFVSRSWPWNPDSMGPRRARAAGIFRPFIPDLLQGRTIQLDARVAADVADAELAAQALDARAAGGPEVLARLLLRAEAVGSSRVEGLVVSPRRLALAAFDADLDPTGRALEVVGNIHALQDALALALVPAPVTVEQLCAVHRRLLAGTRDAHLGGLVRTEQNWIGGLTPVNAEFVPPPPEQVPALLGDLCAYLSGDDHSPLMQAALAHAQFETIHPFADGNGRTGRALIQWVLRRRGLCRRFVPPISLVLATWSKRYVAGLTGMRSESSESGIGGWLELMAHATRAACVEAAAYEVRVIALVAGWREAVRSAGTVRADAAAWSLLEALPAAPLITATSAATLIARSERAVDGAIATLVQAGVLKQVGGRLRYRLYEAVGLFDVVASTERALASPTGDTRRDPPRRPVPARP